MGEHPTWPNGDRIIQRLMDWLSHDLYRQRPHRGGYAMENPPGNIRVEFEHAEGDPEHALVRVIVNGDTTEAVDPDVGWLDETVP